MMAAGIEVDWISVLALASSKFESCNTLSHPVGCDIISDSVFVITLFMLWV